jgi:di/tricarboxylate transporter
MMSFEQAFLFGLIGAVFALLIWGRVRYDLVAFGALIVAVVVGVVPADEAFMGFGNPAVVIIALVLVVSRALLSAGAVEVIARHVVSPDRSLPTHIGIMSLVGAGLSAVINNVAALAVLMTVDMDAAKKAKRAVSLSLMPLSFAAILGGMITMIGTPPNIVVAQIRERAVGEPFRMFDFSPVGLVCALAGIVFVATIGWRLIPHSTRKSSVSDGGETERFVAEAKVPDGSDTIGRSPPDLYELGDEFDVTILGLVRRGKRLSGFAAGEEIRKGDFLVLEGNTKNIEAFIGAAELSAPGQDKHGGLTGMSMTLVEAVVPQDSRLIGRTAHELRLIQRRGVTLLGLSRQGRRFRERVRNLPVQAGDVVLLLGPDARVAQAVEWFGLWPIEQGRHPVVQRHKALLTIGIFVAAIAAAVAGFTSLPIALGAAVGLYALLNILAPRDVYEAIDWPVIVLLASLIPIGVALERYGGTQLVAEAVLGQASNLPVWAILALIMVVTMTMSDFLNNVATALIAAPISIDIANALGVSPDPFLMGVAVAASCAFLTPIGHQNNTIIMGPGGYRFGDYWRMGLPLEILIICVSVPAILLFWPL